jgi:hypothetical protein
MKKNDIVEVYKKGEKGFFTVGKLMKISGGFRKYYDIKILRGTSWYFKMFNSGLYGIKKADERTEKVWKDMEEQSIAYHIAEKL